MKPTILQDVENLYRDESGQDFAEVALLIAGVSLLAVGVVTFYSEPMREIILRAGQTLATGANRP